MAVKKGDELDTVTCPLRLLTHKGSLWFFQIQLLSLYEFRQSGSALSPVSEQLHHHN